MSATITHFALEKADTSVSNADRVIKNDALAEISLPRCAGGRGGWGKSLQVETEGGKGVCRVGGFECPRKIGAWRRSLNVVVEVHVEAEVRLIE